MRGRIPVRGFIFAQVLRRPGDPAARAAHPYYGAPDTSHGHFARAAPNGRVAVLRGAAPSGDEAATGTVANAIVWRSGTSDAILAWAMPIRGPLC